MAASTLLAEATLVDFDALSESESLSDEQIDLILQEATERLKAKAATNGSAAPKSSEVRIPKLQPGELPKPYVKIEGDIAKLDKSGLAKNVIAPGLKKIEDPVAVKKQRKEEKKATAGPGWFDMPRTDLTPELKRDLQLLKQRTVLDPHRHYKKDNSRQLAPTYSQVGTIVEGPTEFYSARINNRDRKKTFVEEVLAEQQESGRFKRKYDEIQQSKTSGKKTHYKTLKAKRKKGFK